MVLEWGAANKASTADGSGATHKERALGGNHENLLDKRAGIFFKKMMRLIRRFLLASVILGTVLISQPVLALDYQAEAIRQYPSLKDANDPLNRMFAVLYRQIQQGNSRLLNDPQWPLVLVKGAQFELECKAKYDENKTPKDPEFKPDCFQADGNISWNSWLVLLDKKAGDQRDIVILKKLDPDQFPGVTEKGEGLYQFRYVNIPNTRGESPFYLLLTDHTSFKSAGLASINMLFNRRIKTTNEAGFEEQVDLYHESSAGGQNQLSEGLRTVKSLNQQLFPR